MSFWICLSLKIRQRFIARFINVNIHALKLTKSANFMACCLNSLLVLAIMPSWLVNEKLS